jgi:hypothetical protein
MFIQMYGIERVTVKAQRCHHPALESEGPPPALTEPLARLAVRGECGLPTLLFDVENHSHPC